MLRRLGGDVHVALAAHCLVGRSPACTLRIDEALASREQARILFAGARWTVRDLGSRNGTFVNGARLAPGGTRELARGDRLGFGGEEVIWQLVDASPPLAMARCLAGESMISGESGILVLPSADAPLAVVMEDGDEWILEIDGQARVARDGEVVLLRGVPFMLHLPVASAATADGGAARSPFSEVELRFRVSRDEERVEVTVATPGAVHVLPPRAHHYTWVTIARARERSAAGLVEAQRGWVDVDELMQSLRLDETHLNVDIHRIRQGMVALGVPNGASVIERRRGHRQLRLGTGRVQIACD